MDEQRTFAYRYLLYCAMLEIRPLHWRGVGILSLLRDPFGWRFRVKQAQRAGALADWMHNLAHYSALGFAGFDEDRFWREIGWFEDRYPGIGHFGFH